MSKDHHFTRRDFLVQSGLTGAMGLGLGAARAFAGPAARSKPNVIFLLADQWRAEATGFAGDTSVRTPDLDRLAAQSVNMTHAISTCPVCGPCRASLITGRYPLSHGVFMNDVSLGADEVSLAEAFGAGGYQTGYIGKWHLDGHGRSAFIPRERRQGFEFWKALECTHNYNHSFYYGDDDEKRLWQGYDAMAQTQEACRFISEANKEKRPFFLFLSWGPPHAPYDTAPQKFREMYKSADFPLRPNVPAAMQDMARKDLAGYYAHIAALDECAGRIIKAIDDSGQADNTILVFTSDHGDMLYSQGAKKKQQPFDESIRVPFLIRYPAALGAKGRQIDLPFSTPDVMPTLLGLCGLAIPKEVEGTDYSALIEGRKSMDNDGALIMCPQPFGQWSRKDGGREYRGIRTRRYTYARDLKGPWLLFDNETDPFQMNNLIQDPGHESLRRDLDGILNRKLQETHDDFKSGPELVRLWKYTVDETETVPYTN